MKRPVRICTFILALLLAAPVLSCGSDGGDTAATSGSATKTVASQAEQAARLAAQTQLKSAQSAQDTYFSLHQTYAATAEQLRGAGVPLSPRVKVVSGDSKGYEMSVEVNNQEHTTLSVKKTESRIEHTDSDGNSW